MSAIISHRITTYFKLPKGETGLTQLGTKRINTLQALDWIIEHAPDGAFDVEPGGGDKVIVIVDLKRLQDSAP